MNWQALGMSAAAIALGMALYAFGDHYHASALTGFAVALIGGGVGHFSGWWLHSGADASKG